MLEQIMKKLVNAIIITCMIWIALIMLIALMSPSADAADRTKRPKVTYPMSNWIVQIEGPKNIWGMRHFARKQVNRRTPIWVDTRGRCRQRPHAVCVKVIVRNYGKTWWKGMAYHDSRKHKRIYLNSYYSWHYPYASAGHELAHVLGMRHHRWKGMLGRKPNWTRFSWPEVKQLRKTYRPMRW